MEILLGPQLLKIIFVGLTGTGYFDSMKKGYGMATAQRFSSLQRNHDIIPSILRTGNMNFVKNSHN